MLFCDRRWLRKTDRWLAPLLLATVTIGLTAAPLSAQTALNAQLQQAVNAQNWSRAIQIVDRMILEYPENADQLRAYRARLESLAGGNVSPPPLASPSRTMPSANAAPTRQVTETQVRQIMNSVKAASLAKDIQGIMQYIAPDALIQVSVQSPFGSQTIRINREEYQRQVAEGFAVMENPRYLDYSLQVQVAPDGLSAIARESTTMTVTIAGQPMMIRSVGQTQLQLRQGQVLITAIQGQSQTQLR